MNLKRRQFIRAAGGLALAGTVGRTPLVAAVEQIEKHIPASSRIAVLTVESFKSVDGFDLGKSQIEGALEGKSVSWLNLDGIKSKLNARDFDLFVNPYGSAFPAEAFSAILQYLRDGGSFLNLGGTPFGAPCLREAAGWRASNPDPSITNASASRNRSRSMARVSRSSRRTRRCLPHPA